MKFFGPPDIQRLKARKDSDALMRALRHDLSSIRQEAAAALGELGVGAAVGALCELVQGHRRKLPHYGFPVPRSPIPSALRRAADSAYRGTTFQELAQCGIFVLSP